MPTNRQVRFILKPVVFAACLAPLVFIGLRIAGIGPSLGPNPVEVLQDEFGEWALRILLATLTITPLRLALGKPWPLRLRRMLGLFAFTYAALLQYALRKEKGLFDPDAAQLVVLPDPDPGEGER